MRGLKKHLCKKFGGVPKFEYGSYRTPEDIQVNKQEDPTRDIPLTKNYKYGAVILLDPHDKHFFTQDYERMVPYLNAKYGENTSYDLEQLARTTIKKIRAEYEEEINYYKTIVDNLKKEKGIE